jgi:trimeric autotransporter adhesin
MKNINPRSVTGPLITLLLPLAFSTGRLYAQADQWINGLRVGRGGGDNSSNTVLGLDTLSLNSSGIANVAIGRSALVYNETGNYNTSTGFAALALNKFGGNNTAVGTSALYHNDGSFNTAIGNNSLFRNSTGLGNTASGFEALRENATGVSNAGFGGYAAASNIGGHSNTAVGYASFVHSTYGSNNTAVGEWAGSRTVAGDFLTNANQSVYLGADTRGTTNDNNAVVIGYNAYGEGSNTTVIGNSSTLSTHLYGNLNAGGGALTASAPHKFTQTWNASGVNFTGLMANITGAANSGPGSLLLDLQADGVSKFKVDKLGNVTAAGSPVVTQAFAASNYLSKAILDPDGDGKINPEFISVNSGFVSGTSPLVITNETDASPTTGALRVEGGMSAGKDSYFNGLRLGRGNGNIESNTAVGLFTLGAVISGTSNTATGAYSLFSNTAGSNNSAFGYGALSNNTTGSSNTATGGFALLNNTYGSSNTANGFGALILNQTGHQNTSTGNWALSKNTTGADNTAAGYEALVYNVAGNRNTAIGVRAGCYTTSTNTSEPLRNAADGVYIGYAAIGRHSNEINAIVIGANAQGEGSNTVVIGKPATISTHLFGKLTAGKVPLPADVADPSLALVVGNGSAAVASTAMVVDNNGMTTLQRKGHVPAAIAPTPTTIAQPLPPSDVPHVALKAQGAVVVNGAIYAQPQGDIPMYVP